MPKLYQNNAKIMPKQGRGSVPPVYVYCVYNTHKKGRGLYFHRCKLPIQAFYYNCVPIFATGEYYYLYPVIVIYLYSIVREVYALLPFKVQ